MKKVFRYFQHWNGDPVSGIHHHYHPSIRGGEGGGEITAGRRENEPHRLDPDPNHREVCVCVVVGRHVSGGER